MPLLGSMFEDPIFSRYSPIASSLFNKFSINNIILNCYLFIFFFLFFFRLFFPRINSVPILYNCCLELLFCDALNEILFHFTFLCCQWYSSFDLGLNIKTKYKIASLMVCVCMYVFMCLCMLYLFPSIHIYQILGNRRLCLAIVFQKYNNKNEFVLIIIIGIRYFSSTLHSLGVIDVC